jgi:hypothetical protein
MPDLRVETPLFIVLKALLDPGISPAAIFNWSGRDRRLKSPGRDEPTKVG